MNIQTPSRVLQVKDPLWDLWRDGVTQSLINSFLACPERVLLGAVEGLEARGVKSFGGPLYFGEQFHACLEQMYTQHRGWEGDYEAGAYMLAQHKYSEAISKAQENGVLDEGYEEIEKTFAILEPLLVSYAVQWKSDFERMEWVELEHQFDIPFDATRIGYPGKKIRIRGKRDGGYYIKKDLCLFETKTKSRIEDEWLLDKLSYDFQVQLYSWAMEKDYGKLPTLCTYNLVKRPGQRIKQKESLREFSERIDAEIKTAPNLYYRRHECFMTLSGHRAWIQDFHAILKRIADWFEGGPHYKVSASCSGAWGPCWALPICARNERASYTRKQSVFNELEGEE